MEKIGRNLRKGAWTKEEDLLLTKCIQLYGEGRWHLLPSRAGLSRCRKSCRMRWLNYLKPNLKRGYFDKDEVDLILRLHKLLGNRWSLIAGRLPGRTANNVKNFWNSHICKKPSPKMVTDNVVKPRTRMKANVKNKNASPSSSSPLILQEEKDESIRWWRRLLQISENGEGIPCSFLDED